ncbi:hypothetical protein DV736_g2827, partial [Chaetothyriales sp. CBS 134916]
MFILTTISDLVSLPPHTLYNRDIDNLTERLNSKYANRVLPRVGLCICLYDIINYSDGLVGAGTGNVNVNVEFRLIVFRPFKGEILTGVIKRCTRQGLEVSVQFFENISVPKRMLFEGTVFEEEEKEEVGSKGKGTWVWRSDEAELWFDQGTVVNVRVEVEKWGEERSGGLEGEPGCEGKKAGGGVSYSIEASIMESGLGGLDWW